MEREREGDLYTYGQASQTLFEVFVLLALFIMYVRVFIHIHMHWFVYLFVCV